MLWSHGPHVPVLLSFQQTTEESEDGSRYAVYLEKLNRKEELALKLIFKEIVEHIQKCNSSIG